VLLSAVFALLSAGCFAVTSVLQHRAAREVPDTGAGAGLVLRLLHRPLFLLAVCAQVAGLALQTLALGLGALVVVQPLLVCGLLLAIPLSTVADGRPVTRRELGGAALVAAGLAAFLLGASPGTGRRSVPVAHAAVPSAALATVAVVAVLAARRRGPGRAAQLAFAAGCLYGISAAALDLVAHGLVDAPVSLLRSWPVPALVVSGAGGLVLTQAAYQSGSLAQPLAMLTVIEPLAACLMGALVLDESLAGGVAARLAQTLGALVAAAGVVLLSTTPAAATRVHVEHAAGGA